MTRPRTAVLFLVALARLFVPAHPAEARDGAAIDFERPVTSITLDGDRLYVSHLEEFAAGWGIFSGTRLSVYDLSSPDPKTPLGSMFFYPGEEPRCFAVEGRFAFMGLPLAIRVLDVSDPGAPQVAATVEWPEIPACITLDRGYAYVGGESGVHIVDVTDPTSPKPLGAVSLSATALSVAVRATFAYAGTSDGRLAVVDVSDPSSPVVLATLAVPGIAASIRVRGSYAYVASGPSGLQLFDVSRPALPRLVAGVDTPGDARGVALSGPWAYVADRGASDVDSRSGLRVIDVSNPMRPVILTSISKNVADVSASRGWIAFGGAVPSPAGDCIGSLGGCPSTGYLDVGLASASESVNPPLAGAGTHAARTGTDGAAGPPAAFRLTGADPNPFNPATTIRFDVLRAARVRIAIFDASGRRVATLEDAVVQPGRHDVSWRGTDDRGGAAASGIYFVTMEADGVRRPARKLALLK